MTDVLGLELDAAVQRLMREGLSVATEEVRSRKGTGGSENRVVRQTVMGDGRVVLTYAAFVTELAD